MLDKEIKNEILNYRISFKIYENLPYGKKIIRDMYKIHKIYDAALFNILHEDNSFLYIDYYKLINNEISKFYTFLFKHICIPSFEVFKTKKEQELYKTFKKKRNTKEKLNIGFILAKLITKRFNKDYPKMKDKGKYYSYYFNDKMKIIFSNFFNEYRVHDFEGFLPFAELLNLDLEENRNIWVGNNLSKRKNGNLESYKKIAAFIKINNHYYPKIKLSEKKLCEELNILDKSFNKWKNSNSELFQKMKDEITIQELKRYKNEFDVIFIKK